MWNNSLCELWNLMLAHQVKWNKSLCAAAHFTLRSNISLPKAISQIPQGIYFVEKGSDCITIRAFFWQGHKDLNPEPTVLETAALPIELYPYLYKRHTPFFSGGPSGIRTRDYPVMSRRLWPTELRAHISCAIKHHRRVIIPPGQRNVKAFLLIENALFPIPMSLLPL